MLRGECGRFRQAVAIGLISRLATAESWSAAHDSDAERTAPSASLRTGNERPCAIGVRDAGSFSDCIQTAQLLAKWGREGAIGAAKSARFRHASRASFPARLSS